MVSEILRQRYDSCVFSYEESGCNHSKVIKMYLKVDPGRICHDHNKDFVSLGSIDICGPCGYHRTETEIGNDYTMTISEASKFLHVHTNTLRRWSNQGKIPSYRICERGDRRFRRGDIENFMRTS